MEETQGPPRVTALIIARNCADALRRCLDALARSEQRESIEVLVVDSGSTDGTRAVTQDRTRVHAMTLPKHFGKTKALNIGCRTAKGKHILLLDPYVEVAPDTVKRLADRLEASEDTGAVSPFVEQGYGLPGANELAIACRTGSLPSPIAIDPSSPETAIDYPKDAPMLVRRGFIRGMNYFDEHFGEHWPDLEMCWQLRNAGKQILVLSGVRVTYHACPAEEQAPVYQTDCTTGAAAYLSKHHGFGVGFRFRLTSALSALTALRLKQFSGILAGEKVDGK